MPSGRHDRSEASAAIVAGDLTLGAGLGTTASVAIDAGSNDQGGRLVITSAGTGQAQATGTVKITFKNARPAIPVAVACRAGGTTAVTTFATVTSVTATDVTFGLSAIMVAADTAGISYIILD